MSVPLALTVLAGSLTGSAAVGVAVAGRAAAATPPVATVPHGPSSPSQTDPFSPWSRVGGGIPLPLPGGIRVRLPLLGDLPVGSPSPGPHPSGPPGPRQPRAASRSAGADDRVRPVIGETPAPPAAAPAADTVPTGLPGVLSGVWTTVLSLVAGLAAVFAFLGVLAWLRVLPRGRAGRN